MKDGKIFDLNLSEYYANQKQYLVLLGRITAIARCGLLLHTEYRALSHSRVHVVMKASLLSNYVKGTFRFPKTIVGTLGNVWHTYIDNFKVILQCVNGEIIVAYIKHTFTQN